MSSSMKSFVGCKEKTDDGRAEESGWTSYLEDFSVNNNSDNYRSAYSHHKDYSRFRSPSLHSDAASPVALKDHRTDDHDDVSKNVACSSLGGSQVFKRLKNLKKSKKLSDPDLEDTASSPINSPKVTVLKRAEINQKKIKENTIGNYSIRVMKKQHAIGWK